MIQENMFKTVSQIAGCKGCPMQKKHPEGVFVAPKLPTGTDLVRLVIAEAPGLNEAEMGEPLVGGSGKMFNKMLDRSGIARDGLTIMNVLQCRPKDNVFPTDKGAETYEWKDDNLKVVHHCVRNHVLPMLESRAWRRIDLIGAKALEFIGLKDGIYQWRGSAMDIDTEEIRKSVS